MFTEKDKSSFKYWFAHWCAFQMVALNCGVWKFKYLFHDMEKPWLSLIWKDHKRVKKYHRINSRHHLTYRGKFGKDYEAMIIDWECSRYTKSFGGRTAREQLSYELASNTLGKGEYEILRDTVDRLGLQ